MTAILVVAEHLRGTVSPLTGEMVGFASALKDSLGATLTVAVISDRPAEFHSKLALEWVDEIVSVTAPTGHFDPAVYEEATVQLAQRIQPRLILVGHTVNGMAYGPSAAVRLGGSFASDVFGAELSQGRLLLTRGGYGNKVLSRLDVSAHPVTTMTVRGGSAKPPAAAPEVPARAVSVDFSVVAGLLSSHVDYADPPPADVDITKAEFILSIGRGIQDEKNIERFRALADRLGATFGCSRPIADSGWLPKAHQVGLSGKVASNCKLYVALGISGAVQHLHGMKHVETIVAINTDRNAPIYNVATYGACADLFEFSDALEECFN
jgi:electron transfer flavoprotein alpha subunit